MTKSLLFMLLGAFTASGWWALATLNISGQIVVPVVLLTIFSTVGSGAIIVWETAKLIESESKPK